MTLVAGTSSTLSNPVECTHHPERELHLASALYEFYTHPDYSKFTFNIVPCYRGNSSEERQPRSCDGRLESDSQSCHFPEFGGAVQNNHGHLDNTMCPSIFVVDYNQTRIPSQITMAVCDCRHCHRGRCVPVLSFLPVLVLECNRETSYFEYVKSILEVPIGCACKRHRLAESQDDEQGSQSDQTHVIMEI